MRNLYKIHFINPFPGGYQQAWNGHAFSEEEALNTAKAYCRGREMRVELVETGDEISARIAERERQRLQWIAEEAKRKELELKEAAEREIARVLAEAKAMEEWREIRRKLHADNERAKKLAKAQYKQRQRKVDKANASISLSSVAGRFAYPVDTFYTNDLAPAAFIAYA